MNKILLAATLLFASGVLPMHADQTKTEAQERVQTATATLHSLTSGFDKGIPDEVYKGAKCIAVVPRMIKGGFIVTGRHGRGVASCRLPDGSWSAPAFFTISGGSWGLQIGVEDVDLVMMIMNDEGARHLIQDKFEIGGSASGAVGPFGRYAAAALVAFLPVSIFPVHGFGVIETRPLRSTEGTLPSPRSLRGRCLRQPQRKVSQQR